MKTKKYMMPLLGISFALLLTLILLVPAAHAYDSRTGDTIVIEPGEVIEDDLYLSGSQIIVDGTIKGDLVVMGEEIIVNGIVEGDILGMGQSLTINGQVEDDVRIMGMALTVGEAATIADDFIGLGYSLEAKTGSLIEGDMLFFGGQALLAGNVTGDVQVGTASLELQGQIGGDLTADVGTASSAPPMNPTEFMPNAPAMPVVAPGLTIGDNAQVGGESNLKVAESQAADEAGALNNVTVDSSGAKDGFDFGDWAIEFATRLIAFLLVALLFTNFTPTLVYDLARHLEEKPLPSLGWGALIYFVFPLLFMISALAIVLLGILFNVLRLSLLGSTIFMVGLIVMGALLALFVVILLFLTKLIVAYPIGKFILDKAKPDLANKEMWVLTVGLVILTLLIAIPYAGVVLNFIVALVGVGAIWLRWREHKILEAKIA